MAVDWSKYGGDKKEEKKKSVSGVDWDKYDPIIQQEKKRVEGVAVRAAAPDAFDPFKQNETNITKFKPIPRTVPQSTTLPSAGQILKTDYENMAHAGPSFSDKLESRREQRMEDAESSKIGTIAMRLADPIFTGLDALQIATRPAAKVAEQFYTPGAGLSAINAGTQAIGSLLGRVAPKIAYGSKALPTIARSAIQEAGVGAPIGAGQVLASNPSASGREVATGAGLGAVTGAAGGAALTGLGRLAQSVISKYRPQASATQPGHALPAPRQRGNANAADSVETITPEYTFKLPEASEETISRLSNVSQARGDLKVIDDEIRQLNSSYDRAIVDEYNYLKQSLNERGGVQQGQLQTGPDGDVLGRAGRISQNPLWYQEFYAAKGKVPSNKELYQLARERVDNGFKDEAGNIPSWKEQNGFEDNMAALQDVRTQINGSLRELDPAINITDAKLKSEGLAFPIKKPNQTTVIKQPTIREAAEIIQPQRLAPEEDTAQLVKDINNPRKRDRVYKWLDQKEKSARQRMAKRRGNINSNPLPEWGDMSVIMAAKMGKGTIKLADFTEEAVKEFGESIRPQAQRLYQAAKEQLRKQERIASKEGQDADTFNNSGVGDASTFEGKISRGKKADRTPTIDKWERFKTQFTEDIAPINRLERNVTGQIASAEDSIYKSARMYKGVPEKINQFIDNRLKPIVRGVEKAGYNSDDLGRYALAVHAKDVNAAGYKSGFTNAEIDDVIRKLNTPEMEAARKSLVNINRELLDDLVESGVVSAQLRDVLNERWQNYIPLFRDVDDVAGHNSGLSEALANVANPLKKLKGSEKNVIEPLENMVRNITKNISAAERNKVASHISRLSKLDPENKFIRKLNDGEQVQGKNVVSVKENGDNVHYEVDKDVRDALLTLDKESSTWLMRFLSTPASWLRAGATLTPEFMMRNPIRDYRNAKIISDSGFRLDDYAVGLASSIMGKFGKGKLYQDWVDNLGAYGNIVSEDKGNFAAAQRKILTQSPGKKFVNVVDPRNFIALLRGISDITESSTKVGEYRAALRKGASKEEAAYRSRDLMDFARAGSSIRQTNKIVAFLNANIQGKSKTIRAFKNHPVRTTVRVVQHMAVPTVGIHFYNKQFANDTQKETIRNAPDWQRNTFWLVAVPGTDMVARIPKPFDFAVVANVVDRALDFWADNDKEAFEGFGKGVLADNALPMMITGLQPLLEGVANYSGFKQGPIIPQRDQGLKFEDQYDPIKTSEAAKAIAGLVDSQLGSVGGNFRSPYIIDNTIQGLFAGGGKYVTDAVDAILGKTGAVDRVSTPEKRAEQKPVARSFLVDPLQGGKDTEKFYNELERLEREKRSASINERAFREEALHNRLSDASESMNELSTRIRQIERSDLTAAQKRAEIEPLIKRRNTLAQKAIGR